MNIRSFKQGVALTALLTAAGQAGAVTTYDLCTGTTTKTMPDSTVITMWGYGIDTGAPCAPTVPGPQLTVPAGDNTLTINLRNELTDPVSIVIPGQQATMTPVFFADAQGRQRVRSFTHETTTIGVYTWNNIKPGTYLYQSGTHPAVQVQMGLYGAVTQDAAVGEAYTGVSYDNEVLLLYSEIDPALHAAVAGGTYGTASYPSTVDYAPEYFLVNGAPFVPGDAPLPAGTAGSNTLVRLLNAGLEDHAMVLQGQHMTLVAEDGNVYPFPRVQHTVLMAAGKTKDAIFTPAANGTYPVYDRRLRSGMFNNLSVAAAVPGPTANDDPGLMVQEDSSNNVFSVLANDTQAPSLNPIDPATVAIVSPAVNGQAIANPVGTVSYTPNPDFSGADSFTYTVRDTSGNVSNAATVSITVTAVNDDPVAVNDNYSTPDETPLMVAAPGVLGNDNDADGDVLTATVVPGMDVTAGVLSLNTDGSFTYTPNPGATTDSFTYSADDSGGGVPSMAMVTIEITPVVNQPPLANDDYATVTRNTGASNNSVTINVVLGDVNGNGADTDADGTVVANTVTITANPNKGAVVNNGDGTITYTPTAGKRGSDAIGYTVDDDDGATSNEATVRVDILKN